MRQYHQFLCRQRSDVYMLVVEGELEEAIASIKPMFDSIKQGKSFPLNCTESSRWKGDKHIGNCRIVACWFSYVICSKKADPLAQPEDEEQLVA